jgi:hypothetical protein
MNNTDTRSAGFGVDNDIPRAPVWTAIACHGRMVTFKTPSNPIQKLQKKETIRIRLNKQPTTAVMTMKKRVRCYVLRSTTNSPARNALDDVAVVSKGQACRECRVPLGGCVVDGHKAEIACMRSLRVSSFVTSKEGCRQCTYRGQMRSAEMMARPSP